MGSQRVGYDWATELNWNPQLKNPVRKDANTFIHFIFLTGNHKLCYQENIHSLKYFFKLSILYWSIAGQQTFLVAQLVKNPPAIHPVGFPSWEASLEKGKLPTLILLGFPGGSEGRKKKKSAWNAGDLNSITGLGRSPGGVHATPSSILAWKIPMDRGAWRAIVHGIAQSRAWLSN